MTQSRIELLSAAKSAINAASFAPTEQRINEAKAALTELFNYVESLTPKASPDKPAKAAKQRKAKAVRSAKAERTTPEDYLEAKQQRESRGIAIVFTSPEAKPERKVAKQLPTDKPAASEYHSIEDAIRDIRTQKLAKQAETAQPEAVASPATKPKASKNRPSRDAAMEAALADMQLDMFAGVSDLDIDLSDVPF